MKLPDKTQLFLAAFWTWTWILLQFNKLCQVILHSILAWAPDSCIPTIPSYLNRTPIKLIKAFDKEGNAITNKLNLFLNLRWDPEIEVNSETNEDNTPVSGGVDINDFGRYVGTTAIWAAYLLDYKLSPIYNEFIESTKNKCFSSKDFDKLFKAILIDISNKLVYRLGSERSEPLQFGEVAF